MNSIINIDRVSIIFGRKPEKALSLADDGKDRPEIQAETGNILGVHDCSIEIAEGEIVVLMGLSGSGKSTLLRAINRLNPITRGSVTVRSNGKDINVGQAGTNELKQLRTHTVSMVFQQFGLLPWRTVAENVGFGLEVAGVTKKKREETVREQLALVGLGDWADRTVGELSGGMQQRVGLARAFATGAPILLMDEPFSALDPLIRNRLQDELLDLQSRLKKTIIFVSHDLDEAMKLGSRIAIMEGGRIIQCGTAQEILLNPVNEYVADFVAHMNPLTVLTAADVMRRGKPENSGKSAAATAKADTRLSEIIVAIARNSGSVGVVDNGAVIGEITADDIVGAIARYQHKS